MDLGTRKRILLGGRNDDWSLLGSAGDDGNQLGGTDNAGWMGWKLLGTTLRLTTGLRSFICFRTTSFPSYNYQGYGSGRSYNTHPLQYYGSRSQPKMLIAKSVTYESSWLAPLVLPPGVVCCQVFQHKIDSFPSVPIGAISWSGCTRFVVIRLFLSLDIVQYPLQRVCVTIGIVILSLVHSRLMLIGNSWIPSLSMLVQ